MLKIWFVLFPSFKTLSEIDLLNCYLWIDITFPGVKVESYMYLDLLDDWILKIRNELVRYYKTNQNQQACAMQMEMYFASDAGCGL